MIYMYGGVYNNTVTNELWLFDTVTLEWTQPNSTTIDIDTTTSGGDANNRSGADTTKTAMFACVGHTAHLINGSLYIIFGYNPVYGYLSTVQLFNIGMYVCSAQYLSSIY